MASIRSYKNEQINPMTLWTFTPSAQPASRNMNDFTRLRVISHNLRIDTGRSHVPREQRLCTCGLDVQTEEHFLCQCQVSAHLRGGRQISIDELFRAEPEMLTRQLHYCLMMVALMADIVLYFMFMYMYQSCPLCFFGLLSPVSQ